jgi:xanthine dehydrogenase FAD-binding subunit
LTTFTQISQSSIIKEHLPSLNEAALSLGGPQIRNCATIGGNLCNGAPSADSASTLYALNARLQLQTLEERREISIRDFYLGPGKVNLKPGELLTSIKIYPEDYRDFSGHYIKFAMRKAMDIATLGVSVLCKLEDKRTFKEARIALGVAGPTPIRCEIAEEYVKGKEVSLATLTEVGKYALKSANPRTSWRASKEYREHLIQVLTQRALLVAIKRAGGEDIA